MNFNSSYTGVRLDIVSEITGANKSVLDLGCATGLNGKYLLDNKIANKVCGVELDNDMALEAKKIYEKVIVGSLDDTSVLDAFNNEKFDVILCGDILEHLEDPWNVLKKLRSLITNNGILIISLPNIQHIDVLIHLFKKGTWPINNRGIFDKTHKHFFTRSDIQKLAASASFKIEKFKSNFRFRDKLGSKFPFYGFILKKMFPKLYTFQYIAVCSPV